MRQRSVVSPEAPHDKVGQTLAGKFKLTRLIGSGGMGAVYEGVHTWTERIVAIKVLFDEAAAQKDMVERFFREARAATKIGNPHIIDVLDMGQEPDGTFFIVQEYLRGETLRQYLDRVKKLTPQDALEIFLPIMDALIAAHGHGITHRDIKPENIMLHIGSKGQRQPKIIDFGIAKFDEGRKMTARGEILGTPSYMSPEQAKGEPTVSAQADVWAVGVVLYECLCGTKPFEGRSLTDLLAKIVLEAPRPLPELAPTIPMDLSDIVMRALVSDRLQRWGSMKAMFSAIVGSSSLSREPWIQPWRTREQGGVPSALSGAPTALAGSIHPPEKAPVANAARPKPSELAATVEAPKTPQNLPQKISTPTALSASKTTRNRISQGAAAGALFILAAAVGAYTLSSPGNGSTTNNISQGANSQTQSSNQASVQNVQNGNAQNAVNSQANQEQLGPASDRDAELSAENTANDASITGIQEPSVAGSNGTNTAMQTTQQIAASNGIGDAGARGRNNGRNPSRNPIRTPGNNGPHVQTPPEQIID